MLYVLIGEDKPDSAALRKTIRPAHLAYTHALQNQGRILIAGPLLGIDNITPEPANAAGSLIIAEFDSLIEAEEWFKNDPYVKNGVFAKTSVSPFLKILP